jgi:hypothetical protein
LATQVNSVNPDINKTSLLLMIAVGVGLFLMLGMAKTVFMLPLKILLVGFYLLVFICCLFVDSSFVGVAFDAGGATTGPITVPFIMAMGLGVAAAAKKVSGGDNGFGLVGLASIGPIAAVTLMGLMAQRQTGIQTIVPEITTLGGIFALKYFLEIFPEVFWEISMALIPLLVIFVVFQCTLLHLPKSQLKRISFGLVYVFIGLNLFLTGVNGGFSLAGKSLGLALGLLYNGYLLIPFGFVLGAVAVCAEPAVWILTEQVEEVSGGYLKRSIMLLALSFSIACAVALGMIRVLTGLSIWWFLAPGYGLALILTLFCPRLFTSIAFDSGGVASGPMAATFVLSLTLGASAALGGNPTTDAFGMIAMIAMAPLITIQILGLVVRIMGNKKNKKSQSGGPDHGK